jgi:hypothetical protein
MSTESTLVLESCRAAHSRKDLEAAALRCAEAVRLSRTLPDVMFEMKTDAPCRGSRCPEEVR